MLVLVCEFVTGGGMRREELSLSLATEGALMRDALIGGLEDLPGVRVVTTYDDRLPAPPRGESRPIGLADDVMSVWSDFAARADRAWPIAPESDGMLGAVALRLRENGRRVIAPDAETLGICGRKSLTAARLAAAGVPTVPVWHPAAMPSDATGPFVVKPDDGAGCFDTRLCCRDEARAAAPDMIVQPYVEGRAESLTLLYQGGHAHVLSVNRQHVAITSGRFGFHGVTVGARPPANSDARLAQAIIKALPGLHGIVGVDYLATSDGSVVLEINPRLTTSYAGLRQALGINVLAFVSDLMRDGVVPAMPHLPPPTPVEVLV